MSFQQGVACPCGQPLLLDHTNFCCSTYETLIKSEAESFHTNSSLVLTWKKILLGSSNNVSFMLNTFWGLRIINIDKFTLRWIQRHSNKDN
jgi:hypothetical protein